jgi:hypothetical protein
MRTFSAGGAHAGFAAGGACLGAEIGYNRDKAAASNAYAQIRHLEVCLHDQGNWN